MSFPRFSLSSFVTLFSFQGTIFYIDFKFKQVCVQFAFSSTSSRTSVRKTEKKCEMCVKLFELVEMRRIELLTPCLQGRCSPSWATPPYLIVGVLLALRASSFKIEQYRFKNLWASSSYERCSHRSFSSLERRWSSRTFRYGYLVTTSPPLLPTPSATPPSKG